MIWIISHDFTQKFYFDIRFLLILPFKRGNAVNSTSPPVRYRDDPWLFFGFFFNERFANGSIRSTNVPEDILTKWFDKYCCFSKLRGQVNDTESLPHIKINTFIIHNWIVLYITFDTMTPPLFKKSNFSDRANFKKLMNIL